jgi:hypothetical protein
MVGAGLKMVTKSQTTVADAEMAVRDLEQRQKTIAAALETAREVLEQARATEHGRFRGAVIVRGGRSFFIDFGGQPAEVYSLTLWPCSRASLRISASSVFLPRSR